MKLSTVFALILVILLLLSSVTKAEMVGQGGEVDSADVHFAAHFGLSYAITTGLYGLTHKAFRFDRTDALIFSAFTMATMGMLRQVVVTPPGTPVNTKGFGQDLLGIGAAVGSVLVFDF